MKREASRRAIPHGRIPPRRAGRGMGRRANWATGLAEFVPCFAHCIGNASAAWNYHRIYINPEVGVRRVEYLETVLVFFSGGSGIAAHYEYAPFGAVTAATTNTAFTAFNVADTNPYRFSSEYADDALGLVYYNYRHYDPCVGRWLTRDPLEEFDSSNLYLFVSNNSSFRIDILGLYRWVAIYYSRSDQAEFRRAAETYKREIERSKSFNPILPKLNWATGGNVVCHGCNTGIHDEDGNSVAKSLAAGQGVPALGQTGFSQFSESSIRRTIFTRVDADSQEVYLWSYGDGGRSSTFGMARTPQTEQPPKEDKK